jgi:hypothetical protein
VKGLSAAFNRVGNAIKDDAARNEPGAAGYRIVEATQKLAQTGAKITSNGDIRMTQLFSKSAGQDGDTAIHIPHPQSTGPTGCATG